MSASEKLAATLQGRQNRVDASGDKLANEQVEELLKQGQIFGYGFLHTLEKEGVNLKNVGKAVGKGVEKAKNKAEHVIRSAYHKAKPSNVEKRLGAAVTGGSGGKAISSAQAAQNQAVGKNVLKAVGGGAAGGTAVGGAAGAAAGSKKKKEKQASEETVKTAADLILRYENTDDE